MVFVPNMPHVLVCFVRRQMSLYALEGEGGEITKRDTKTIKGYYTLIFGRLNEQILNLVANCF